MSTSSNSSASPRPGAPGLTRVARGDEVARRAGELLLRAQAPAAATAAPSAASEDWRDVAEKLWRCATEGELMLVNPSPQLRKFLNWTKRLLLTAAAAGALWFAWTYLLPASHEQRLIQQWIATNQPGLIEVERWYRPLPAPGGEGTAVRVDLRYRDGDGPGVQTPQWFVIQGDEIVRVASEL